MNSSKKRSLGIAFSATDRARASSRPFRRTSGCRSMNRDQSLGTALDARASSLAAFA
jgi:hypothetical protein